MIHRVNLWGSRVKSHKHLTVLVLAVASGVGMYAFPQAPKLKGTSPSLSQQWIREAIDNEIKQQTEDHILWAYQELIRRDGKEELREMCQTSGGEISRLVALDAHPLSAEQQRKEDQRIQQLLARPVEVRKQQQKRTEDIEEGRRMLEVFPRAFQYKVVGTEGDLIKIAFIPDPSFDPLTRQQEVLRHLEGTLWIATQQKRVARIEGHLVSDVRFFGGVLGSLDKGGSFYLRQGDVGSRHWEMVDLDLEIHGRALLFKTIAVQERRQLRQYREVPPNVTLEQGADLIRQDALAYDKTVERTEWR